MNNRKALFLALVSACSTAAQAQGVAALEEVIVTAQHRAETLQSTGLALSAVTGEAITNAGVTDVVNLSKMVPALVAQPSGGNSMNFYLRGVGTLQGNSFGENAIGYYFNGVYISRPTAPAGSFYDLERLEVLKGPQGTLYGRNATGGALSVIPKTPAIGELSGHVSLELGNYDLRQAQGAVNLPLTDTMAMRVAGQVVKRDGYLSDGYQDEDGKAGRVSLLMTPTDALTVTLMADYFKQGGKGMGSVIRPSSRIPQAPDMDRRIGGSDPRSLAALAAWANAQPGPFGQFLQNGFVQPPRDDGYVDGEYWGLSAAIDAEVGPGLLTVIPAYRVTEPEFRMYVPGFRGDYKEEAKQKSLETRYATEFDGPLNLVAGAYWFDESNEAENQFSQGLISTAYFTPNLDIESWAVFGQATYELTDTFRLVAGVRYTDETREQSTAFVSASPQSPSLVLGPAFPGELKFDDVTWKLGFEWDIGYDSLLYANVATGFKAGSFFVAAPPNNTYDPEELTAYTIGSKNTFLDNRLRLNLELFYWDYKDQQINFVGGVEAPNGHIASGGVTVNAGQATMKGAELEMQYALSARTLVGANIQYLDGEYDELEFTALSASGSPLRSSCEVGNRRLANPGVTGDNSALYDVDCAGKPTLNSPEVAANLMLEHTFELGQFDLIAGIRTRIESSRYVSLEYLPEHRQESYTMSDAYLTLEPKDQRWSLTTYVNNLEDETVLAGGGLRPVFDVVYVTLRPPRTYGARFTYNF